MALFQKSLRKEEHISLIGQPGNHFLQFVPLDEGCAIHFLHGITNVIDQDFDAIGSEGTVVNAGHKGGVIRLYEEYLQHALRWLICLLHFTELPLRVLFTKIDGVTTGPSAFTGQIGKAIKSSLSLPVVKFRRIQCTLPNLKHQRAQRN